MSSKARRTARKTTGRAPLQEEVPDPNAVAKHGWDILSRSFASKPRLSLREHAEQEEYIYSNDAVFFIEVLEPTEITRPTRIARKRDESFYEPLISESKWENDKFTLVPDAMWPNYVEADPDLVPAGGSILIRATWIQRRPFAKPGFVFPRDSSRIIWEQIEYDMEKCEGEGVGVVSNDSHEHYCDGNVSTELSDPISKMLTEISEYPFELVARTGRTLQWFVDLGSSQYARLYYHSGEVNHTTMQFFMLEDSKLGLGVAVGCYSGHPFIYAPTFVYQNSDGSGPSFAKDFCSAKEAMQTMISAFQSFVLDSHH